ncbi:MAG: PAS domain-containing protein [Deltaproteobacteria bacterium]|nr:PAS domain-containing protein [Deltaproteobacteria bacterium]
MVERFLLSSLAVADLNIAHGLRGLAASLLATAATAIYLLRFAVPSIERASEDDALGKVRGPGPTHESLVRWLLALRWVAVLVSALVVAIATVVSRRVDANSIPALWAGVAALVGFNIALRVVGARRLASPRAIVLQLASDVAILGWFLHHAGGMTNPFAGFFVLHAAVAGIALDPRLARRVGVGIAGFVLAVTAVESSGLAAPGCLLDARGACAGRGDWSLQLAAGFAVALIVIAGGYVVRALVRVLHAEHARLVQATETLTSQAVELERARVAIHEERQNLQAIIDCMADAVLFVEPNSNVRFYNQAAVRLWPGGAPEKGVLTACHRPEKWAEMREKLMAPRDFEFHPVFELGGRTFEASYARVCDADGALRGVVMVARDVTERVAAQKVRMQQEKMAVVGKMAAGLAHELNNPLGAIALFAQHALKQVDAAHPLAEHLETVLRNANLCKRTLRELLEYARQRTPERRAVDLGELVADVIRTLEPKAREASVVMAREGDEEVGTMGDADQLRQVLVNLGLNAIEAMPKGGALTFRVLRGANAGTRVEVVDTGTGISDENRDQVFSAFFTTKAEGTGLGLAIVQDIIVAHGGTISFLTRPKEGTTFVIELPGVAPRVAPRAGDLKSDRVAS